MVCYGDLINGISYDLMMFNGDFKGILYDLLMFYRDLKGI